ncbi:hypothetical protein JCM33374_g2516 [Metschnikowia sp. JCM 33374]|nr:hypothetical protein JCM33374_g2516 [Metschnikowia sp. JCM 33374]
MSSISPAVKVDKPTTSLPPISDIFRGPTIADTYYAPPAYASYRSVPAPPSSYYSAPYQLATPEYVAAPYYRTPYATPKYSFAGETGYASSRGSSVDVPYQFPSPAVQAMPPHGHVGQRVHSAPDYGMKTPEYQSSQPPSRELSPRSHTAAAAAAASSAANSHHSKVRTRNNLPKEVTHVLLTWLNDHLNHPYPNSFEKAQLILATGLNQQQLSNWFINARRRKIKFLREKSNSSSL